jgi:hypothetical protein
MEILIESTKDFETDFGILSTADGLSVTEKINGCTSLFPLQKSVLYHQLSQGHLLSELKEYESSLYILSVDPNLAVIIAIDEDPIFNQVIFTLFRVVTAEKVDRVYATVFKALYRDLVQFEREPAQVV